MKLITSPEPWLSFNPRPRVFLAGTIDNGNSDDWQQTVIDEMKDYDITIYNPRRKVWDPNNQDLIAQIKWELNTLEDCNTIFMYFAPNSLSPISLLELGLFIDKKEMIIVCPKSFYRYENVKAVCNKYIKFGNFYETLEDGLVNLKKYYSTRFYKD